MSAVVVAIAATAVIAGVEAVEALVAEKARRNALAWVQRVFLALAIAY
jgi:hypothetical protein